MASEWAAVRRAGRRAARARASSTGAAVRAPRGRLPGNGADGGQASDALPARADGGHGVLSSREVEAAADGLRVRVAVAVITRQRPGTAKSFCFITLEDETGVSNLILSPEVLQAHRLVVVHETFLLAEGILQNADGTAAVKTEVLKGLSPPVLGIESHDFH